MARKDISITDKKFGRDLSLSHALKAFFVLMRNDALIPRECDPFLPLGARLFLSIVRFFLTKKSHLRPGQRLAIAFSGLGPAFIKLGQVLSTRADIFGDVFVSDLSHLKDKLNPFAIEQAKKDIEAGLGRSLGDLGLEIIDIIGSASIAQVHKARLNSGELVAIKLLRPGIERVVSRDIALLRFVAALIEMVSKPARRLEPKAFVETVAGSLMLELDLRIEASACDELGAIMTKDPFMRAPKIKWALVARRVLGMEWITAFALNDANSLIIEGLDRPALANNLIRSFLSQSLNHGLFHADLHEGNLFVEAPDRLIAVDFGIIGRLGVAERRYLAVMLWGFLKRDYRKVAEIHFEAGYVPAHHSVERFAQALRAVGEPVFDLPSEEISMGRLLGQLFEVTAQFDMHLRPELVLMQKTMVSVEGVARRIDKDNNIWEAARPIVKAWISREVSPLADLKRVGEQIRLRLLKENTHDLEAYKAINALKDELKGVRHIIFVMSLFITIAALGGLIIKLFSL